MWLHFVSVKNASSLHFAKEKFLQFDKNFKSAKFSVTMAIAGIFL
jgi:hypothetical protein